MTVIDEHLADHDDDTLIVVTADEFRSAAKGSLRDLGLTYAELEKQAHDRSFTSAQAHALWVSIGGTVDL
ncbi:hypothetical protein [Streptomyces sp. Z26]|uniref:hypothetical protein n=1 Tax=Streptomyces sp. Z26 TaxID=2500177 RepID=UPI000EF14180|nr:hypothetical protein [Streptomyces sp. Z26]RLL67018.1 hypothetical protein D7M15_09220 [Streptomyces sp. Z26]